MTEEFTEDGERIGKSLGHISGERALEIPVYDEEGTILHGLHQGVLQGTVGDAEFSVTCGAGLGSDHVSMEIGEHKCVFYLRDVLKAWAEQVDPEKGKVLPRVNVSISVPCANCKTITDTDEMNMSPSKNALVCETCFDREMERREKK